MIQTENLNLIYQNGKIKIVAYDKPWIEDEHHPSYIQFKDGTALYLKDISHQSFHPYNSGTFEGFYIEYVHVDFSFRTFYLIDRTTQELFLRFTPLVENKKIKEVYWPSPFVRQNKGYHVLPYRQGLILPYEDLTPLNLPFNGQFCSAAAYLAMLGTVEEDGACLMINQTPWDSRYYVTNTTRALGFCHLPSLGKMNYRRDLCFVFFDRGSDYNTLAKYYRHYLKEQGHLRTLREKQIALPQIEQLIKSSFVHMGIQTFVQPDSRFYDSKNPEKNNHLTTFETRMHEMEEYAKMGMKNLYLHLDGWGVAYDNNHPDVMPINQGAGGPETMARLQQRVNDLGYLFGIHDQYRDYYHRAKSYNLEYAVQDEDGTYYAHDFWAGGMQNYLCATQARDYVKRNFTTLKKQGVHLDGAYLDVFTCNELDECFNVNHKMTRKDCADARMACFNYLIASNIMPSSEEINEWAMDSLVFCHYAPYEFMMHENGKCAGIGIPLFNLVYHDCAIIPWMMDRPNDDYMLYALLNGGAPYFRRDAAYPNIDGAFEHGFVPYDKQMARCLTVSDLHQKVAGVEMISHRFIDHSFRKQETVFANGIVVSIDLDQGTYAIK